MKHRRSYPKTEGASKYLILVAKHFVLAVPAC